MQVGDPFMEKVLLEACLEALKTGAVVGIQDMGAAGLTCSTSEMGSRAGTGIEVDVAKVPKRETGMTAYEVMLSESQERMLLVAEKGREREVMDVFDKWDLHAEPIGRVTDGQRLRVWNDGSLEADVPTRPDRQGPLYERRGWSRDPDARGREALPALRPGAGLLASWLPLAGVQRWIYGVHARCDNTVTARADEAVVG